MNFPAGTHTSDGTQHIDARSRLASPMPLLAQFLRDVPQACRLAVVFVFRDIRIQQRQSMFGHLALLIPPLATALLWIVLQASQAVHIESGQYAYPVYILSGVLLWQTFADATVAPANFVSNFQLTLTKVHFPREALILAALLDSLVSFVIRAVVVLSILLWLDAPMTWGSARVVGIVMLLALMGTLIGVMLLPLVVLFQDMRRGLALALQLWMYLSPVVYLPPPTAAFATLGWLNPVTPLILTGRSCLLNAGDCAYAPLGVSALVALAGLLVMLVFFRLAVSHLAERMGS